MTDETIEKNTLQQAMEARDITVYYIVKTLERNVRNMHSFWSRKIAGKVPMTDEQLEKICTIISKATPDKPLKPEMIKREILHFYVR